MVFAKYEKKVALVSHYLQKLRIKKIRINLLVSELKKEKKTITFIIFSKHFNVFCLSE